MTSTSLDETSISCQLCKPGTGKLTITNRLTEQGRHIGTRTTVVYMHAIMIMHHTKWYFDLISKRIEGVCPRPEFVNQADPLHLKIKSQIQYILILLCSRFFLISYEQFVGPVLLIITIFTRVTIIILPSFRILLPTSK